MKPTTNSGKSEKTGKAGKQGGYCVYLGPTIYGVLQHGKVFAGSRAEVMAKPAVKAAVEKHPGVAQLIASNTGLARDRADITKPGTRLYAAYRALLAADK